MAFMGLYQPLLKTAFIKKCLLYCFMEKGCYRGFWFYPYIKNGLYQGFFALLLYRKQPLSRIFCFIALLKTAFICLYQPLSKIAFFALSKTPFLAFIENGFYQGFFALSLYRKRSLSKTAFFALSLY